MVTEQRKTPDRADNGMLASLSPADQTSSAAALADESLASHLPVWRV